MVDPISQKKEEFLARSAEAVELTRRHIDEFRTRAAATFEVTKRERQKVIAKAAERLAVNVSRVRERHVAVRNRLNQEAVRRDVNLRVNRSLEALEGFIRETRGISLDEAKLIAAINDPTMSGTARDRERKLSVSELIVSVQRQLVQQSEFINIAAHELRTPITPILTYIEILESSAVEKSEELDAIKRNALRLQRLAENILHVARIDSKSLNLSREVFDLNAFLEDFVRERAFTKPAPSSTFISSGETAMVFADKDRIGQVISNLLDNALRYARNDSAVVTVTKSDREAIVKVIDHGPGIDASVLPILFTKFAARAHGGTGLGLFICKGIVEAHGGRITARNKDKTETPGAVFEFTLPLYEPDLNSN